MEVGLVVNEVAGGDAACLASIRIDGRIASVLNVAERWTALRRRSRRPGEGLRALSGSRKAERGAQG